MPAVFKLASAARGAMAAALITHLDDHASPWYGEVYAGTIPATVDEALASQTKLGTVTGSADPSATQTGGLITFNPITSDSAADASGEATFLLIFKGDGSRWALANIGNLASDATCKMNTTTVVAGGPIAISAFTIAVGA